MARWEGDTLMHNWYGSDKEDDIAIWDEQKKVLLYDCIDDTVEFKFYYKPTSDEAFEKILNYQNFG